MRIGIDFDDTIADTGKKIREYIDNRAKSNEEKQLISDNLRNIMMGDLSTVDKSTAAEFINDAIAMIELKADVKNVIDRLKKAGHEIYLVTARSNEIFNGIEQVTLTHLANNGIEIDNAIFGTKTNKLDECVNNKIDLLVDDSVDIIEYLNKNGVDGLLFTSEVNKNIDTDVKRVDSWLEVEKYIEELSK